MSKVILIVEDYEDTRRVMKKLIEGYGYKVVEAADGQEAIEQAKNKQPDLILMDLSMPLMNGLTATQIIRESDEKVPIIALTAYGKTMGSRAIELGCNSIISKPLDFDTLEPLLKKYLN